MTQFLQMLIGGLLVGSVYALIAVGFSLIYRVTGVVSLAQGAFSIVAALLVTTFGQTLGWPVWAACSAAVIVTTLASALLGAAIFVPALARLPESSMLMVTAGMLILMEGFNLLVWGNVPFSLPQFSGERPIALFGINIVGQGFWIVGALILVIAVLHLLLGRTEFGRALRGFAENPIAARLVGIEVRQVTLFSFALAACVAAIGGVVFAPITSFQFDTGNLLTISGFIAVAVGGMGSFGGAIVGGLLLGVVEQLSAGYISSLFSHALTLVLLLGILLLRPQGLVAARVARRHDVRDRPQIHNAPTHLERPVAIALGLAAILVLGGLPWLGLEGGLLDSLTIAGILGIAVIGLDVLMGYAGQVSLGHAGFVAVGGYAVAILSARGLPPILGLVVGQVVSLACATLLSLVTKSLRGHYLAIATLAFSLLVDSLTVGWTELTGGPSGIVGIPSLAIWPIDFGSPIASYYLVAGLLLLVIVGLRGALTGDFGRTLMSIRTDPTAAAALGIDVPRYRMAAFAISASLASLAGSLYACYFHFLSPEMVSTGRSLELVTMMVVGGEGSLIGPLVGTALLTLLPNLIESLATWKTLVEGALLILVFRYMPQGLYGALVQLITRATRRGPRWGFLSPPPAGKANILADRRR